MARDNSAFFEIKNDWSVIKDRLLGCYLPAYFQKVLFTHKPIFYVDCFAGKGKFDDGNDGSPIIALKIRDDCISRSSASTAKIDTCFIDLNHADDLRQNLVQYCNANGSPQIVSGRYENEIETILADRRGANVFLYIDPYGIKALDFELFAKFADYGFRSIEMLINMNSFGFMRAACRAMKFDYILEESLDDLVEYEPTTIDSSPQSVNLLNSIAGGNYWQAVVDDYNAGRIDGYQAEMRFSTEYKQRLRTKYSFVLDMPIRLKPGHRPKYRMIHVSNHPKGCILMADNMFSRSDELCIDVQNNGQLTLFDCNPNNDPVDKIDIGQKMLSFLTNFPNGISADVFIAYFLTVHGLLCKSGTIGEILRDMEKKGLIEVTRDPALTITGKPTTFFEVKGKNKSVIIKKKS